MKPERVQVVCPACGQEVQAVASDGRVKGYCAVAKRYVDFLIETQVTVETKADVPVELTPIGEGRDSKGCFAKGNVPWNKKAQRH